MLDTSPWAARPIATLSQKSVGGLLALTDLLAINLAVAASILLRMNFAGLLEKPAHQDYEIMLFASAAILVVNFAIGLYPGYGLSEPERFRRQIVGVTLVFAMVAGWDYLLQHGLWSRMVSGLSFALALFLTVALGEFVRGYLQRRGRWGVPVAVLGIGESVGRLVQVLREREALGFIPVVVLSDDGEEQRSSIAGLPVLGPVASAHRLAPEIRHAFVAMPHLPPDRWSRTVERLGFAHVFLLPEITGRRSLSIHARDLQGTLALEMADNLLDRRKILIKRVLDLGLAAGFALLFLPLFLAIVALVRLTSRGPALFVQPRVGKDGRIFSAYKFRTMVLGAEARLHEHLEQHADARAEYATFRKLRNDPRITRVGAFLRRYSLDELPQFINVLKGDMSLVGPRCYLPEEVPDMNGGESLILRVLPGITGLWQVSGRNRATFAERVEMDTYYIRNWSVSFDLYILYRTIWTVLSGRDAY